MLDSWLDRQRVMKNSWPVMLIGRKQHRTEGAEFSGPSSSLFHFARSGKFTPNEWRYQGHPRAMRGWWLLCSQQIRLRIWAGWLGHLNSSLENKRTSSNFVAFHRWFVLEHSLYMWIRLQTTRYFFLLFVYTWHASVVYYTCRAHTHTHTLCVYNTYIYNTILYIYNTILYI